MPGLPARAAARHTSRVARRRTLRTAGNCYSTAVREAEKVGPEALVCHGTATGRGPLDGIPHGHAWVEIGDLVIDRSNGPPSCTTPSGSSPTSAGTAKTRSAGCSWSTSTTYLGRRNRAPPDLRRR